MIATMERYRCGTCHKWYQRLANPMSCCVLHSPGECCHFMEREVTRKGWTKRVAATTAPSVSA